MGKLPPATKLTDIKPGAIQLWAPLALEMAIKGEPVRLTAGQQKVFDERHDLLRLATTEGSWNHQQMLRALALWTSPEPDKEVRWWTSYLKYQLGDFDDDPLLPATTARYLLFWNGSEGNGNYCSMNWGCVCAVDLWCRPRESDRPDERLVSVVLPLLKLCQRYHRSQVALCRALPTAVGPRSGEHPDPLHLEMWRLAEGRQSKRNWPREIDWPMRLAKATGMNPGIRMVGDHRQIIRPLFCEIRCAKWADGTQAFWMPERTNPNTPCYLIEVIRPDGARELIYPWQKGRGANDKRPGGVILGTRQLHWGIGEDHSEITGAVDLPSGPPTTCYAVGKQGYVEGDWAAWLRGE